MHPKLQIEDSIYKATFLFRTLFWNYCELSCSFPFLRAFLKFPFAGWSASCLRFYTSIYPKETHIMSESKWHLLQKTAAFHGNNFKNLLLIFQKTKKIIILILFFKIHEVAFLLFYSVWNIVYLQYLSQFYIKLIIFLRLVILFTNKL